MSNPSWTAVIINYRTPDLTTRAVESFRHFYPNARLLLIDNGSGEEDVETLKGIQGNWPEATQLVLNRQNLHHGPAMDQALHTMGTEFALFIDSDCEVRQQGFPEVMLSELQKQDIQYTIGKRIYMDRRGFEIPRRPDAIPYIRPVCMMLKRSLYLNLPPFERHGTPCLANMKAAVERGLVLLDFPIDQYITHLGRGTASRHGYRLGLRGKWNYLLHRLGL